MFNVFISEVESQITAEEIEKAKKVTGILLETTEGIQFNMIAFKNKA